jgi:putative alpha-1,2-mannosidase
VISSIGLFDVKGLTDENPSFALGAPLFDKVTIRLSDKYYSGKEFVITTSGNEKGTSYVQQYSLNGQQLHEPRIPFSEIVKGGRLDIQMGNSPKDNY